MKIITDDFAKKPDTESPAQAEPPFTYTPVQIMRLGVPPVTQLHVLSGMPPAGLAQFWCGLPVLHPQTGVVMQMIECPIEASTIDEAFANAETARQAMKSKLEKPQIVAAREAPPMIHNNGGFKGRLAGM